MTTELNLEEVIAEKVAEVTRDIEQRPSLGPPPGTPVVDAAADNMTRVAELLVKGMRDATAETAKRFLEVAQATVREALAKEEDAKQFTERLLAHTETKAAEFTDFFHRRRNALLALTQIMNELALPGEIEDKSTN
jgi:hypothetical protein